MTTITVRCAVCGHVSVVEFYQRMDRYDRPKSAVGPYPKIPDVWICDLHLKEWYP